MQIRCQALETALASASKQRFDIRFSAQPWYLAFSEDFVSAFQQRFGVRLSVQIWWQALSACLVSGSLRNLDLRLSAKIQCQNGVWVSANIHCQADRTALTSGFQRSLVNKLSSKIHCQTLMQLWCQTLSSDLISGSQLQMVLRSTIASPKNLPCASLYYGHSARLGLIWVAPNHMKGKWQICIEN